MTLLCVLDSSVAMAMVMKDENTDAVGELLADLTGRGALVPSIFHLEVGNALLMAERRKRLAAEERFRAIEGLEKLVFEVDMSTPKAAWRETSRLAEAHRLTLYDASYLELALRAKLPLATFDAELRQAASKIGVVILPPATR